MQRNSIKSKGLILYLFPLIIQVIAILFIIRSHFDELSVQKRVLQINNVILLSEEAIDSLFQTQSYIRASIITKNPYFEEEFRKLNGILPEKLAMIKANIQVPSQQEKLVEIENAVQAFLIKADEIFKLIELEKNSEVLDYLKSIAPGQMNDLANRLLKEFQAVERVLATEKLAELDSVNNRAIWILLFLVLATFISSVFIAKFFDKTISKRIERIVENMTRFSKKKALLPHSPGEDEIARLDQTFHSLIKTLQDREQEIEMFVYSVSHDLRSPLVNLQGFSDELTGSLNTLETHLKENFSENRHWSKVAPILEKDCAESITYIKSSVERLHLITNSLLKLSRVGNITYDWKMADLNPIVKRVLAASQKSLQDKKVILNQENLPEVYGDAAALEQVFANLISNAIKYLDPNREGVIDIGINWNYSTPDFYVFYVQDNGVGLKSELQNKMFHIFQRFHPHLAEGEGIGLTIVKKIVERHGGAIWVTSKEDKGSTFYFKLLSKPNEDIVNKNINIQ